MARPPTIKLEPRDREWGCALATEIDGFPGGTDELYPFVLRELKDRLGLDAALCYGISTPGDFVQLEFAYDVNFRGGGRSILGRHLDGRSRPKWGYYNPLRPEPQQANRVLSVRDNLAPRRPMGPDIVEAAKEAGVLGMDQVRVLLCDGPVLLAWVGGFRSETIDANDRAIFASIVPALLKRVTLDNQLQGASLRDAAFGPVLEALGSPAVILRPNGAIALTNAAGRTLLDQDGSIWRERLANAVAGASIPGIELTPFPVTGSRPHLLALLRPAVSDDGDTSARARIVGGKWGLTPRHIEVLERLAWGDSNKSIAGRLGCSERTVENHLAAIMERVDVGSRAELVARFWTAR